MNIYFLDLIRGCQVEQREKMKVYCNHENDASLTYSGNSAKVQRYTMLPLIIRLKYKKGNRYLGIDIHSSYSLGYFHSSSVELEDFDEKMKGINFNQRCLVEFYRLSC